MEDLVGVVGALRAGPASPVFLPATVLGTLALSWGVTAARGAVRVLRDRPRPASAAGSP